MAKTTDGCFTAQHCMRVLDNLLVQLSLTEIQLDELWSFIEKKTLPRMIKAMVKKSDKPGYGRESIQKQD